MEHRIIQGGEQYLPFARARIKALRATGLQYASQRFIMPGGEQVSVRIEPNHDYIAIGGTGGSMVMDSGVVEVWSIAPANPARYHPGTLSEAGHALGYNTPFVYQSGAQARTKPVPPINEGQFSGTVKFTGSAFKGAIGDALSFSPNEIAVSPATDPPSTEPNPADDALADKKRTAILCPASIFTGRCRLYVQALYGRALHGTPPPPSISVVSETTAAPALRIPTYKPQTGGQTEVLLDTSCGVWLDPSDGQHWLVQPSNGVFYIYRLRSSATGEKAREHLIPATSTLNDQDREHLEAYILAYSLPDANERLVGVGGFSFAAYSMGYGWHWNWSGNTADIVINDIVAQDETHFANESTHYSVSLIKKDVEGGFAFETPVTKVEGPKNWAVYRPFWAIVEPNYASFTLTKTTAKLSNLFICDAPFYVFYSGDEKQVCRVIVTFDPGVLTGTYENGLTGGTYITTGLSGGSRRVITAGGAHFSAEFRCGSETTGKLPFNQQSVYTSAIMPAKVIVEPWFGGFSGLGDGFGSRTFESFGGTVTYACWLIRLEERVNIQYKLAVRNAEDEKNGYAEIIVPFYDSEAIFMHGQLLNTTNVIDQGNYVYKNGEFVTRSRISTEYTWFSTGAGEVAIRRPWTYSAAAGGILESYVLDGASQEIETISEYSKLIAGATTHDATFTNAGQFRDNLTEEISSQYGVLSSAAKTSTRIVISDGHIDPAVGLYGAEPLAPVIVGWV